MCYVYKYNILIFIYTFILNTFVLGFRSITIIIITSTTALHTEIMDQPTIILNTKMVFASK